MKVYHTAKQIVERLRKEGHQAYFAGGWVRDYLMGHPSSDIDIATDAAPEEIVKIFRKTIPVGMSFGVVVVVMNAHHFEVSTFRKDIDYKDGRRPERIALTNDEEDAKRRDFTINGMFFDPVEEKVIDYVNGRKDIENKIIRTIGDPYERFREDRLRMVRAIRFAFRFGFRIDEETRKAIKEYAAALFPAVAMERVWQELQKMAERPGFDQALLEMHRLGLLSVIFPKLSPISSEEIANRVSSFKNFPESCPAVLYLLELFPDESLDDLINTCLYLKVSNKNQKLVEFTYRVRGSAYGRIHCDEAAWAKLYADPSCDLSLEVVAARLGPMDREAFLKSHEERKKRLSEHIARIREKSPLVSSEDLMREGIPTGKNMGILLAEAEKISINNDISDKKEVIDLLKRSNSWPKHETH